MGVFRNILLFLNKWTREAWRIWRVFGLVVRDNAILSMELAILSFNLIYSTNIILVRRNSWHAMWVPHSVLGRHDTLTPPPSFLGSSSTGLHFTLLFDPAVQLQITHFRPNILYNFVLKLRGNCDPCYHKMITW